ncbi:MAG: GFA family protein [Burkholderiales bacterium]|nr:GFA family protein [Burkholderiales bacterium]
MAPSPEPGTAVARCHCGAVEAVASFPSRFCAHCYCWSCRTSHAAGVVTWIGFKRAQVRFTRGEGLLETYVSSPGTVRRFCRTCGTRFTFESSHGRWADEVHLPLALFVTPVDREPSGNSFPAERPDWAPFHAFPE